MDTVNIDAWFTLGITAAMVVALAREWAALEVIMMTALTVLMLLGILTPQEAIGGFGSPTVLTIGALLVVGAGVQRSGLLGALSDGLLGNKGGRRSLLRMMLPAATVSAFLNNTPIVAMLTPAILDWCKRRGVSPSRMLMPLSYATILGGMCTLIGTSTNLVVDGLMRARGMAGLGMFEIGQVGLPISILGIALMLVTSRWLLPDRQDPISKAGNTHREFLVEMIVDDGSPLIGKSITNAGMRNLPGLFLAAIERQGGFIGSVRPGEKLRAQDRLVFTGLASTVVDLQRFHGLSPAPEAHYDPAVPNRRGHFFEAVVSRRSPLVDRTMRDVGFRGRYGAVVIAVHRDGYRVEQKLGNLALRPGDTLMLEAAEDFDRNWSDRTDFSLVSRTQGQLPPAQHKATISAVIVIMLVIAVTAKVTPTVVCAFVAAGAMVLTGVLSARDARRSVGLAVLMVIACAMGIGRALEVSGAAEYLSAVLQVAGYLGPYGVLAATFLCSVVLNAAVGNVAAAAIVFPVAMVAAAQLGINPRPLAVTVAVAASVSFLTPTAYPTNLMIYGPGGYRFTDFARLGSPLIIVVFLTTMLLVPWGWPL